MTADEHRQSLHCLIQLRKCMAYIFRHLFWNLHCQHDSLSAGVGPRMQIQDEQCLSACINSR